MDFITVGNDCPIILEFNLRLLEDLYPNSCVHLYDWGHKAKNIQAFRRANRNLKLVTWHDANQSNYMYQKVICIRHCFERQKDKPLMYFDSDVIITETVDEIFDSDDWDIAATWRPDTGYRIEEYGVGTWLNAGVLFINNSARKRSLLFLREWERRCSTWFEKSWWVDQVELTRMFSEVNPDLSTGPGLLGCLILDREIVQCRTLSSSIYNYLPEPYKGRTFTTIQRAKVLHLKSKWRKVKFRLIPPFLRGRYISWIRESHDEWPILANLNLQFNNFIRVFLQKTNKQK